MAWVDLAARGGLDLAMELERAVELGHEPLEVRERRVGRDLLIELKLGVETGLGDERAVAGVLDARVAANLRLERAEVVLVDGHLWVCMYGESRQALSPSSSLGTASALADITLFVNTEQERCGAANRAPESSKAGRAEQEHVSSSLSFSSHLVILRSFGLRSFYYVSDVSFCPTTRFPQILTNF